MAALLGASVMLAGAGGCDSLFGRVAYNGQSYTPEELRAKIDEDNARRTRDAEREAQAAAAESAERAAQAAADAAKRSADFELAVTRIEGDAKTAVMELRAKYAQDEALASAAWSRLEAQMREQIAQIRQDAEDDNAERSRSGAQAIAKFENERGMLGTVFAAAEAGAGASGIPLLSLGVAALGALFGVTGRKKAADQAWDEATAAATAAANERDKHYDAGKNENALGDALKAIVAMATNKAA